MLLGLFSDTHLGFGSDERFEEAFARFDEAIEIFKERNVDFILHAGDLFDEAVPNQEVWHKTMYCFNKNNSKLTKMKKFYLGNELEVTVKGIPIIAIHGTHEFRGKDFSNALDVLEEANCLLHLHAGHVLLESKSDGMSVEKVFVHGLGGVPEKNAKMVLEKYSPKPFPNATNLLLLHQSFKEFLPFNDDSIASLSLGDLPEGFDFIIDGHLHWSDEQNVDGKKFLLTGSTIFTQMKNLESEKEKGVFIFDTAKKRLEFVPFLNQRKLFYQKIVFKNAQPEEVVSAVSEKVDSILSNRFEMKPLIRFKLTGTLAKGFSQSDIKLTLPEDKAIFSVSKEFEFSDFKKKIEHLKEIQTERKSILELGINLLEKNVDEAKLVIDTRRIFSLLSEGEIEKTESILLSEKN
jgi:DNA repair exonuclease SbcCD nuclease subunit